MSCEDRVSRAYKERNFAAIVAVKAALAAGWKGGYKFDSDKNWDADWCHVIYLETPEGKQISWHMSPEEAEYVKNLPSYGGEWDGTFLSRVADLSLI